MDDKNNNEQRNRALAAAGGGIAGAGAGFGLYELYNAHRDEGKVKAFKNHMDDVIARILRNTAKKAGGKSFAGRATSQAFMNFDKAMSNAAKMNGDTIRTDFSAGADAAKGKISAKSLAGFLGGIALAEGADLAVEHAYKNSKKQLEDKINGRDKRADLMDAIMEKQAEIEKKSSARDVARRTLTHTVGHQILNTSAFLLPTAAVSYAVGRNLYGGMERVVDQDDLKKMRVTVDIPNEYLKQTKGKIPIPEAKKKIPIDAIQVNKEAMEYCPMRKEAAAAYNPEASFAATDRLRGFINKHPFLKKVNDFMAQEDYKGPKDLAYMATEGLPREALRGLTYTTPLVATWAMFGRNPKAGFAPIKDTPTLYPDNSRITFESAPPDQKKQ